MSLLIDKFKLSPHDSAREMTLECVNSALPSMHQEWSLADLSLDGIVLLDDKRAVVDANPRALVFLRTSLSAISGYSLWDVVSQEVATQHEEAAELALSDVNHYVFVVHESFENSWVEYTLRRNGAGFVLNLREAGPAQKYQRMLEDSKRSNQLIFEANPNAMWVFDKSSYQIFAVNQAAIVFYGIARKTFLNLGMEALFPEGEGIQLLHSLHADKDGPPEMRLCRQKKKDGKEALVELAWSQVNWNGRQAVLVSLADISDRHIADTALKKSNAELQQSLFAQQTELKNVRHDLLTFTQAVSSDLQDSLHVAHNFAARLAEKYSPVLDDQGLHYVKRIQASMSQLARLVDDLRTLAQLPLRSGKPEMLDLVPICRPLFASLRKLDPDRNVTIEMDSRLTVFANRGLLTIALTCLLDNAWKFTAKKSEAWIKVGLLPGNVAGELVLVVADNGAGFDPIYSSNLFTAFQRLHSSAEFPGNGLGLAIIKRVAQVHGGTVWAESSDQMGASFFMSLPQAQPDIA
ncbi:MAG: PAS domain S-box protein [Polaromonas sp.]|nr:PAS domain S-box protein [Polaromonas sp.]